MRICEFTGRKIKFVCSILLGVSVLTGCSKKNVVVNENKVSNKRGIVCLNKNNRPFTGTVLSYHPNGKVKEKINFVDGVRSGKYTRYYDNGKIEWTSEMKNGEDNGKHVSYRRDGSVKYTQEYVDGLLEGEYITYFENGKVNWKGQEKYGASFGERIVYFENGNVKEKGNLYYGKWYGKRLTYFESGKLMECCHFYCGRLDGNYESFYENGKPKLTGTYFNGLKHGDFLSYSSEGALKEKIHWENGKKHGDSFLYYPSGMIYQQTTWRFGETAKTVVYNQTGKILSQKVNDAVINKSAPAVDFTFPAKRDAFFETDYNRETIYAFTRNWLGCTPELRNHPLFFAFCRVFGGMMEPYSRQRYLDLAVKMAEKDESDTIANLLVYYMKLKKWNKKDWTRRFDKCMKKVPPDSFWMYYLTWAKGHVNNRNTQSRRRNICFDFARKNVLGKRDMQYIYRLIKSTVSDEYDILQFEERINAIDKKNVWLRKMLLGDFYIHKGWKSRGTGWASSVTEEGWKGFEKYLDAARKEFTDAWMLHKDLPESASYMVIVAKGSGDIAERIMWFNRAVAAQVDYSKVYTQLCTAISPRWGGSLGLILKFGDACYDSGIFKGNVAMRMLYMYKVAASRIDDYRWQLVYSRPGVMEKIDKCLYEWCYGRTRNKDDLQYYNAAITIYHFYAGNYEEAVKRVKKLGFEKFAECAKHFHKNKCRFFDIWVDPVESLKWLSGPRGKKIMLAMRAHISGDTESALRELELLLVEKSLSAAERSFLADLWGRYKISKSAYYYYCSGNSLFMAWRFNRRDLFKQLIKYGINPNICDGHNVSMLHRLARQDKPELTKLLIQAGANVNLRSPKNLTPLTEALYYNKFENVKLLVEAGADVNAKLSGHTVMEYAKHSKNPAIINYMKAHGCK